MVTTEPKGPEAGDRLVMLGGIRTVNGMLLLARPFTVTTRLVRIALPAPDMAGWDSWARSAREQLLEQTDLSTKLIGFVTKKR